ncbi:hypothetical protein D3C71_1670460 [compost metagenome]
MGGVLHKMPLPPVILLQPVHHAVEGPAKAAELVIPLRKYRIQPGKAAAPFNLLHGFRQRFHRFIDPFHIKKCGEDGNQNAH